MISSMIDYLWARLWTVNIQILSPTRACPFTFIRHIQIAWEFFLPFFWHFGELKIKTQRMDSRYDSNKKKINFRRFELKSVSTSGRNSIWNHLESSLKSFNGIWFRLCVFWILFLFDKCRLKIYPFSVRSWNNWCNRFISQLDTNVAIAANKIKTHVPIIVRLKKFK